MSAGHLFWVENDFLMIYQKKMFASKEVIRIPISSILSLTKHQPFKEANCGKIAVMALLSPIFFLMEIDPDYSFKSYLSISYTINSKSEEDIAVSNFTTALNANDLEQLQRKCFKNKLSS